MSSGGKAKYPSLGENPPAVPHCKSEQLDQGGNRHMTWWDCRHCGHRVCEIPTNKNPVYYAVPPCPLSPDWDPLNPKQLTPDELKKSKIPPLCKAELKFREVKEAPAYTTDEEQILAAARKILKEKSESSSSGTTPTAYKSSAPPPPPVTAKRPPPPPRVQMPETQGIKRETREEDMEYVTEIDIALMEEINALETRAAQLRMNMGSKAPARR
jgi:hypothetical protein